MSKNAPQAQQKPNFMMNLIFIAVLMFTFQMFFGRNQTTEARTIPQILAALRDRDAKVQDLSATRVDFPALEGKLKDEKISQDQKDAIELEGAVLLADAQLRAGVLRDDLGRLNNAYNTLQKYKEKFETKPVWQTPVQIPAPEKGAIEGLPNSKEAASFSPAQMYEDTVAVLDVKNQNTPVWGFFPGFQFINFLVHATGAAPAFSYWFAAVLLAIAVRAILFPLSQKQMMHSRQMQQLMPLLREIQDKLKGNQVEMQQRQMELYKEYGLNPMAGCLPMVIQLPVIYLIYQCMLHYRFEFQKGTFLWIGQAMHEKFWWIAPNLGQKDYILLTIYGISMVSTSLLMPVADPSNAKQQRLMSVGISAAFAIGMFFWPALPSGFVLYWATMNILTTLQVILIYRQPMQPLVKVNTKDGGVYPTGGSNGSSNGKVKGPFGPTEIKNGTVKTGTPAKHKPKKRK